MNNMIAKISFFDMCSPLVVHMQACQGVRRARRASVFPSLLSDVLLSSSFPYMRLVLRSEKCKYANVKLIIHGTRFSY